MEPENTPVGKGEKSTNPPIFGFHVSFPGSTSQHLFIIFSSFSGLIMYIQSHGCEVFFMFYQPIGYSFPPSPKKNCNCTAKHQLAFGAHDNITWELFPFQHRGHPLYHLMMDLFYHRKFPVYTVHVYIYIELYNRNIYILYNVHASDIFIVGLTMKSSIQKQKHHNESS